MKSDELLKAIGNVDAKYINEADKYSETNSSESSESKNNISDITDAKTHKSAKKPVKKKTMTTFSQVYRAVLSMAAAVALIFIFVSALNIYKKNNSTASSTDVALDTGTTEDASDESTTDGSAGTNDSSKSIDNSLGEEFSLDTASNEDNATTESSTEDAASTDSANSDDPDKQLSASNPKATVTTVAGSDYSFSVEVPSGLAYYNTLDADNGSIKINYLSTNDPAIILYPDDSKEDYLQDGNVVYITYNKDGDIKNDTEQAYDYIIFNGANKGLIATNRSDWSEKYASELEHVYGSLKLSK